MFQNLTTLKTSYKNSFTKQAIYSQRYSLSAITLKLLSSLVLKLSIFWLFLIFLMTSLIPPNIFFFFSPDSTPGFWMFKSNYLLNFIIYGCDSMKHHPREHIIPPLLHLHKQTRLSLSHSTYEYFSSNPISILPAQILATTVLVQTFGTSCLVYYSTSLSGLIYPHF